MIVDHRGGVHSACPTGTAPAVLPAGWSSTVALAKNLFVDLGERLPIRRQKALPRVVGWLRVRKSGSVTMKLRRVGWEHLCEAIDPNEYALILTWGSNGHEASEQWILSTCAKREIPPRAFRRSVILRLRELLVVIPQKEHLLDLNGRVLIVTDGELSIE